ncbi:MAG: hypothetical protein ACYDCP_11470 [Thermoplasmataceae archaeon]
MNDLNLRLVFFLDSDYDHKRSGSSDYSVDRFNTNIEIKFYGI